MKYPRLIRKSVCKTPVYLTLYGEGLTEDGAPEIVLECVPELLPDDNRYPGEYLFNAPILFNYQNGAKTVFTREQKRVEASGSLYCDGDICPALPVISGGFALIDGVKREIVRGIKARNPDGTVNYTQLDVI